MRSVWCGAAAHWTIKIVAILCARAAYGPTGPEPLWLQRDPTTGQARLRSWTHYVMFEEDDIEADASYDINATIMNSDVIFWTTSTSTKTTAADTQALSGSPGVASVPALVLSAHGAMLSLLLMVLSTAEMSPKKRRPSKESPRAVGEGSPEHQYMHGVDKAERRRRNSGTRMHASSSLKKKTPMGAGQR